MSSFQGNTASITGSNTGNSILGNTNNSLLLGGTGAGGSFVTVPNNNYYSSYPIYASTQFHIQLEKIENGWIVHKEGKKWLASTPEEILKYIQEDTK